jgi:hypothetical protein
MTAARLEELAEWCDRQKETLQTHKITDIADNYADLARCARGWAKVERMKPECLCFSPRKAYWTVDRGSTTHDSAIEAIEDMK